MGIGSWFQDNIVDPIREGISSVGDFFQDPLGTLEDLGNAALAFFTLGASEYLKDQIRDFVAGLVPEADYKDRKRNIRAADNPAQVIYGQVRTGGQLVYIEDDGKDKILLWQCFVLAGHECEEVVEVLADETVIATSNGPGVNGAMNQVNNPVTGNNAVCFSIHGNRSTAFIPTINVTSSDSSYNLTNKAPPNWDSENKLSFQTYVWVALVFDDETFGDSGMPRITFVVKGKNDVYDPRTLTSGYTDNQALAVLDTILWDQMLDEPTSNVNLQSFIDGADIADELVTTGDGNTEARYTVNGTYRLQATPLEIAKSLAFAGGGFVVYTQGEWSYVPGAYSAPVLSFDESDLIGGVSFQPGPGKSARHNTAIGTYIEPDEQYSPVGFPQLQVAAYVTEDGEVLEKSYDFPWTSSGTRARRLAKIDIERNRYGTTAEVMLQFGALQLAPGDRINLTVTELGWTPKIFRVEAMDIDWSRGVQVSLREDAPEVYDWVEGDALALDPPPTINIPTGMEITAPTDLTFEEALVEGVDRVKRAILIVSWADQPTAKAYDIQYKLQSESEWTDAGTFWQDTTITIRDLIDTTYDVRIRAISYLGFKSAWYIESYTIVGGTAGLPTDLLLSELANDPPNPDAIFTTVVVTVAPPADPDYAYALVQYQKQGDPDWITVGPTDTNNQARFVVRADGSTYNVRVFAVSTVDIRSASNLLDSITVVNSEDVDDPDIANYLPAPKVTGLELFEQGNNTEFTGREAKFVWRKSTVEQWYELGSEGELGAGAGSVDQYFQDYQVEVWKDNNLLRTEFVVDPQYVYTYEKNAEDYEVLNGEPGAHRTFELRVYNRGRQNQISLTVARLEVTNPAPVALPNLRFAAGFNVIQIAYNRPADLDFAGVEVYVETTQGFDPNTATPVATVADNSVTVEGLAQGSTYYVVLRPFDAFGTEGAEFTSEFVLTTKTGANIEGLSTWAFRLDPVDQQFIEDNLENDAVPSTKIINLTAAKITTGTLLATEVITSEGLIQAVDDINSPQYIAALGPKTVDGTTYLLSYLNNALAASDQVKFGVDELGNVFVSGTITASSFTNNELSIDADGNLVSTGTFTFGDIVGENYVDFDGTNLIVETPFLSFGPSSVTFGDAGTDQYITFDGTVVELGPGVTIGDNSNRTVTVGATGDYATINLALEALSRVVPAYTSGGFTATIEVASTYVEEEEIIIDGVNLRWITIVTEDGNPMDLDPTTIGSAGYWFTVRNGGASPKINCSINVINANVERLFYVTQEGNLFFAARDNFVDPVVLDCNSCDYAIYVDQRSTVYAEDIDINDIVEDCIFAANASTVAASALSVDNAGGIVRAVSGSVVVVSATIATNIDDLAFFVQQGANVVAPVCQVTMSGIDPNRAGAYVDGGFLELSNASIHGWAAYGIRALNGGRIIGKFGDFTAVDGGSTSANDAEVVDGSIITLNDATSGVSQTVNTITADGIIFK